MHYYHILLCLGKWYDLHSNIFLQQPVPLVNWKLHNPGVSQSFMDLLSGSVGYYVNCCTGESPQGEGRNPQLEQAGKCDCKALSVNWPCALDIAETEISFGCLLGVGGSQ